MSLRPRRSLLLMPARVTGDGDTDYPGESCIVDRSNQVASSIAIVAIRYAGFARSVFTHPARCLILRPRMYLPSSVQLTEVGPRDGLQNEPCNLPTAEKVALITKL